MTNSQADSLPAAQALGDLKVVELSCCDPMPHFAAAMAAKMFADLGAEVIKVEPPRAGAPERRRGPFRDELPDPETGGLHLYLNTNKLGVTLDLENEKARELLFRMLESADILLNPNTPSFNDRLQLDWRTLTARFPKLIVVSLTTFGTDSRYRNLRGGDLIATHMSGVGYETPVNQVTDPPAQPPLKAAGRQAEYLTGFTGATAAMCALFQRKRNGRGQHVDTNLWLSMVSAIRPNIGVHSHDSPDSPYNLQLRTRSKVGVPWLYPCKDGWVSFTVVTDRFWRGAKAAMGNPEWAENEMFSTLDLRATYSDALEAAIIDWLSGKDRSEVFARAQAEHLPGFPVNSPKEVAENLQYKARKFIVTHDHPVAREVRLMAGPCIFSRTPWQLRRGAPQIGEHNATIYRERLGLSAEQFFALKAEGAI